MIFIKPPKKILVSSCFQHKNYQISFFYFKCSIFKSFAGFFRSFIKQLGLQAVSALFYKEGGATLQSSAPSTKYMGESLFVLTCCSSCIAHLFSVQQYVKTTNRQGMHAILFVLCIQLEAIQLSRVLKSKVASLVIYRFWYFLD